MLLGGGFRGLGRRGLTPSPPSVGGVPGLRVEGGRPGGVVGLPVGGLSAVRTVLPDCFWRGGLERGPCFVFAPGGSRVRRQALLDDPVVRELGSPIFGAFLFYGPKGVGVHRPRIPGSPGCVWSSIFGFSMKTHQITKPKPRPDCVVGAAGAPSPSYSGPWVPGKWWVGGVAGLKNKGRQKL